MHRAGLELFCKNRPTLCFLARCRRQVNRGFIALVLCGCISYGQLVCVYYVSWVYVLIGNLEFGFWYQCSRLPRKTALRNDL